MKFVHAAALVVAGKSGISKPADFRGRRVGTPQLGNTQDVAARTWLRNQGLKVTLTGGDATVLPAANPDLLQLFAQGKIDAAWTVEPWVSRLEQEAGGRIFLEQADAITTVLAASARFFAKKPQLAEKFRRIHMQPGIVHICRRKNHALFHDRGEGDTNRTMVFEMTGHLLHGVCHGIWSRGLRSGNTETLGGEFPGFHIHRGAFNACAADIDSKNIHG